MQEELREMDYRIDRVTPWHISQFVALCEKHAAFEKAYYETVGKAQALSSALFSEPPRLYAWVAIAEQVLLGYATASSEYSTWSAAEYLHMDCLFVAAGRRGEGIGRDLLASVVAFARERRYTQVQWQTPSWNRNARRFYQREGAAEKTKARFFLNTGFDAAHGHAHG
jgi:GNAT superfamily N-acetyltransferase